jgi:ATP-dependent helicase/nuclease subunit B
MPHRPLLLAPSSEFWSQAVRALFDRGLLAEFSDVSHVDYSSVRVVVPDFSGAQQFKAALAARIGRPCIPPRVTTLSAWLASVPPVSAAGSAAASHASERRRLMALYAELRQNAWLKKLFTAKRNTDLLPLAQTLVALFDELSRALVPAVRDTPDGAEERWQAALEQLSGAARGTLSDESQLVWSLWKSQRDTDDGTAACFAQMMRLAEQADAPLIWISAVEPDAMTAAFIEAYGRIQPVQCVMLDWRAGCIDAAYGAAWNEIHATDDNTRGEDGRQPLVCTPPGLSLCEAASLEDEALRGAQTIVRWLESGKLRVAIIAQDRVVARRIRALLERAQIFVADETGWKLSTTRTAAAIGAFLDLVATRAETAALLDFLKSPFVLADIVDKSTQVMAIESALRGANVTGGWDAVFGAVTDNAAARDMLQRIADQARLFAGRKTLREWIEVSDRALMALGMRDALAKDAAGSQVIAMFGALMLECGTSDHVFSFSEWRSFVGLQLEATPFAAPDFDRRVVMLQLNGARLRSFDAVLMVGADAEHLPSRNNETLFFANAVRRELGLATRESRQRMQLRDFTELLVSSRQVVLSWQSRKNGEPNTRSRWIERLQLTLDRAGAEPIPEHRISIDPLSLVPRPVQKPAPRAPQLLPRTLSASGYNSLVACPYQFFASRMLGLSPLEELSDMPEKRDYGDWLHKILTTYHETLRDQGVAMHERAALLVDISENIFRSEVARTAAALGYYARWQKIIPSYLAWANEREAKGWFFLAGEQWFEKSLSWPGGTITLHGRIDRIDRNEAGECAVLDYKTKSVQALRDKLREREDHQLAFYGMLSGTPVAHAHYVALEAVKDKTGDAAAPSYDEWQRALQDQLVRTMQAVALGASLPAAGIEQVCQYCDVRGLCRKGVWQ